MQTIWYQHAESFRPSKAICEGLADAQATWDALAASGFVMLSTRP